jgi:hypothetical protein
MHAHTCTQAQINAWDWKWGREGRKELSKEGRERKCRKEGRTHKEGSKEEKAGKEGKKEGEEDGKERKKDERKEGRNQGHDEGRNQGRKGGRKTLKGMKEGRNKLAEGSCSLGEERTLTNLAVSMYELHPAHSVPCAMWLRNEDRLVSPCRGRNDWKKVKAKFVLSAIKIIYPVGFLQPFKNPPAKTGDDDKTFFHTHLRDDSTREGETKTPVQTETLTPS